MATETHKYFIPEPTNLRTDYSGDAIQNHGDTAEVEAYTLTQRHICNKLGLPASYTQYLFQVGTVSSTTWLKVTDEVYTAISGYLTTAELASVVSSAPSGFAASSKNIQFQPMAKGTTVVLLGDSITDGLGVTGNDKKQIYASQGINLIAGQTLEALASSNDREQVSKDYKLINIALGGSNFDNAIDTGNNENAYPLRVSLAYNQRIKTLPLNGNADNNIISIWLGTNDLSYDATVTGADCWARAVERINALRIDFPSVKIIYCTTIKRGTGTPLNDRINDLNVLARANYSAVGVDALCDFEKDIPEVNISTGDVSDTTYYTDTVHLTVAGHALLAPVWRNALIEVSGATKATPLSVSDVLGSSLKLNLDAQTLSSITKDSNNDVSQFDDLSDEDNHATLVNVAEKPEYLATGFNELPTLQFDGTMRGLVTPLQQLTTGTIYVVCKPEGKIANRDSVVLGAASAYNAGGLYLNLKSFSVADSSAFSVFYTSDIGDSNKFYNGSDMPVTVANEPNLYIHHADSASTESLFYTLGNRGNGTEGGTGFNGCISQVVISNAIDSTETRQKIEGILMHRWGLSSKLPALHPYKSAPPTTA